MKKVKEFMFIYMVGLSLGLIFVFTALFQYNSAVERSIANSYKKNTATLAMNK